MVSLTINNVKVEAEEGSTLLEVARLYGIGIPTLCHHDELTPYGACRLCTVEVDDGRSTKLVASCLYPVFCGVKVRTHTRRVIEGRKMLLELLIARCPNSKTLQDLASKIGLEEARFNMENEECILCGLCVRMCAEQMMGKAIGFQQRGENRTIGTPFDIKSEECRLCGGCIYVCPACQLRCTYVDPEKAICGGCANLSPPCIEKQQFNDMMCYMEPCVACEIKDDKK